jgi:hypothetical protein
MNPKRRKQRNATASGPAEVNVKQPGKERRRVLWLSLSAVILGVTTVGVVAWVLAGGREPSAEEKVCLAFARLKNGEDSRALDMLGSTPVIPSDPVNPEEAERLQTEFFLRGNYQVTEVRPRTPLAEGADTPPRFILVTQGSMSSDPIQIKTATGVEKVNRVVTHPDLLVEVRDGKIFGVRTDLHKDPNERPMSKAEAERLKRLLGVPTAKQ